MTQKFITVQDFLSQLNFTFIEYSGKEILSKKIMAHIVHEYILQVLKEEDEKDWSAARLLKDIYDCHSCVIHIAQTYVKGIIPCETPEIFGVNVSVDAELAKLVISRVNCTGARGGVEVVKVPEIQTVTISQIPENSRIIDVRQIPEPLLSVNIPVVVENIPLKNIVQNPYILGNDLYQNIVLYCTKGYQSTLAADLLRKSGFMNLFILKT